MTIVPLTIIFMLTSAFVFAHRKVCANQVDIKLNMIIIQTSVASWLLCFVCVLIGAKAAPLPFVENLKILSSILLIAMFWLALKQFRLTILKWKSGKKHATNTTSKK